MIIFIIKAFILGVVEGVTEFLPISSTGHMIIIGHLLDFDGEFSKFFEVVIQLGAILAVVVLYWNKIWSSFVDIFHVVLSKTSNKPRIQNGDVKSTGTGWGLKLWINVIIAFLPAAVMGYLFNDAIKEKLFSPISVAFALIFGAILMMVIENKYRKKSKINTTEKILIGQALFIGCFQCLALWPGMSRSASTIMGAWIVGLTSVAAAEFSFFLAIPTMLGATLLTVMKLKVSLNANEVIALAVGFVVSFLVALVVIEKFINFLKNRPMKVFAIYRILVGVLILGLTAFNFF